MNVKIFLFILVSLCVPIIGRTILETNTEELLGWGKPHKFCGSHFAQVLAIVCGGDEVHRGASEDFKLSIGEITKKCCVNACTLNYLRQYCVVD